MKHNKKSNVESVDSCSGRQELEQGVGKGTDWEGFRGIAAVNTDTESGKRRLAGGGAMTPWSSRNADETQTQQVLPPYLRDRRCSLP